jgi:phosphomevalonate kinase
VACEPKYATRAIDMPRQIWSKMCEMGKLCGVEIEPEQQTKLLDASVATAGVIRGGVPGGT